MKSLYCISFLCCVGLCMSMGVPQNEDFEENTMFNKNAVDNRDICSLPLEVGVCRALFFRYGYDSTQKKCTEFMYGGCQGNANNFKTLEDCQKACHGK